MARRADGPRCRVSCPLRPPYPGRYQRLSPSRRQPRPKTAGLGKRRLHGDASFHELRRNPRQKSLQPRISPRQPDHRPLRSVAAKRRKEELRKIL